MDATFAAEPPADELVTNIHVIGFTGGRIVVCRTERGRWFLPGGTREAGESIPAASPGSSARRPAPGWPGRCGGSARTGASATGRSPTGPGSRTR
jgi:hypothetical protein